MLLNPILFLSNVFSATSSQPAATLNNAEGGSTSTNSSREASPSASILDAQASSIHNVAQQNSTTQNIATQKTSLFGGFLQSRADAASRKPSELDMQMEDVNPATLPTPPKTPSPRFDYPGPMHKNSTFYIPESSISHDCGNGGLHELACGHWIMDSSKLGEPGLPCGLNCAKPAFDDASPFICPQCRKIIIDILESDLAEVEKEKIKKAQQGGHDVFAIGFIVESVSKRGKLQANVTETVMSIVKNGYGRKCSQAAAPEPITFMTAEEMAKEYEKAKKDKTFDEAHTLNKPVKRLAPLRDDISPTSKKQKMKQQPAQETTEQGQKGGSASDEISNLERAATTTPPNNVGPIVRKRDLSTVIDENTNRHSKKGKVMGGKMYTDEDGIAAWDSRAIDTKDT